MVNLLSAAALEPINSTVLNELAMAIFSESRSSLNDQSTALFYSTAASKPSGPHECPQPDGPICEYVGHNHARTDSIDNDLVWIGDGGQLVDKDVHQKFAVRVALEPTVAPLGVEMFDEALDLRDS